MKHLQDLWDDKTAAAIGDDPLELLRYRSNLLGADRRITNYGGGNTSAKYETTDGTGARVMVLAVKGSGGDLGTIRADGFAVLDHSKLDALRLIYGGEAREARHSGPPRSAMSGVQGPPRVIDEDDMVPFYPRFSVANHGVAPSIDTPLHAFLPFAHVDHLHPDWAIALAASANGRDKLDQFNRRFSRRLAWVPWQRPGFELGLMLRQAIHAIPGCDGIVLARHGLFTWGPASRECYRNTIAIIDELGEFVLEHQRTVGDRIFGGARFEPLPNRREVADAILPVVRGRLATVRRAVAMFDDSEEVLQFVNAHDAVPLASAGTSCPDHFIRTRIRPLYVPWDPGRDAVDKLREAIVEAAEAYRTGYADYYKAFATPESPALRDPNPSVVLIPGIGMITLGASRREARITGEFYRNAIRVMAGATSLGDGVANYVALSPREAFRIESWALAEAKLRRMPPTKEFSRRIFLIVGGGSGIGRAVAAMAAERGAHLTVADRNEKAAAETVRDVAAPGDAEAAASCAIDITSRDSIRAALLETVRHFGGVDVVVNTAALFPTPPVDDDTWQATLTVNVTGNYLLADEAAQVLEAQDLPAAIVLTSSANAIVPKHGSEAYDVSKTAVNHLIRELAVRLSPLVRVNGIAPATVLEGSAMFPRDRVTASLDKYGISWKDDETTEALRGKLADFYAGRTLLRQPVSLAACAEAICWLASDRSGRTTGHVIPVDSGLPEAFMR
jgi:rhamnulose-1-phosphate aldolase/alcohol dehydrogenase